MGVAQDVALTNAQMSIDTGKIRCANQFWTQGTTSINIRWWVSAFCCKTQVGNIDQISLPSHAHQAIFRFDVSVDDIMRMNILEATDELVREHQDCFERKFATAVVEKIL